MGPQGGIKDWQAEVFGVYTDARKALLPAE